MAVNGVSSSGSGLRIGGLATGLDTDSMVKQLMDAERVPLTKLTQQKTKLEWKRDSYRDMTSLLKGFKDEFFNVSNSASFMLSSGNYNKFSVDSSNPSIVTAVAGSTATAAPHTIKGTQLADVAKATSAAGVSGPLQGGGATATDFSGGNTKINVTLDGVTKTITLSARDYGDSNTLINDPVDGLQKLINNAFGAGRITVSADAFDVLSFTANNSKVTVNDAASNSALTNLGFTSGASNRINLSDTLVNLQNNFAVPLNFNGNTLDFSINGTNFSFDKNTKLSDMMNQINNSAAGVNLQYSEATDSFTITSKQKGSGNTLVIANTGGNFFGGASGINAGSYAGKDAMFELDGVAMTRNDNNFTIDGVSYTLKDQSGVSATVTVGQDVDATFDKIKNFVTSYNEIITKVNEKLEEKSYRDYLPLTSEQKSAMKDDDIKAWEEKAKSGSLRGDATLSKVINDLRKATYDPIIGISSSLNDIGIKSSTDFRDKGKLIIDETKLKDAIRTQPDTIKNLFVQTSTSFPSYDPDMPAADRKTRYKEEGIANRFYDALQDVIRTTRNSKGEKGSLIEKAGLVGDITEFRNLMEKEINTKNKEIDNLNARLYKKESRYYQNFSAMEKAISQLNSQGNWLSQQLGQ